MLRTQDLIEVRGNFRALCRDRGKYVRGSLREGHNVFTTTGRDWLAHLAAWSVIGGGGDIPFTQRRVRWMGVGTGTQAEVEGVIGLDTPVVVTDLIYLAAIQVTDHPTTTSVRFIKQFSTSEISVIASPIVPVSEAGLFVDIFPVSTGGGVDDDAVGGGDTTLNPATAVNAPVAYKTFEVINKTMDFDLVIEWTFVF